MAKTAHNDFATFAKQYREHLAAQIALAESHAELMAALEKLLSCCEWKGTATATLNITEFQAALGAGTSALAKAREL